MQKLKKVLKSLVKAKSKKPEKPEKSAKKDSSKKPVVKSAKPKAKASEKPAAKKPVVKAVKKESLLKKPAKLAKPATKAKVQLKPEPKVEHKEHKTELKTEVKKPAKVEKLKVQPAVKALSSEKPAERAPEKLKAKNVVPKAPKEEIVPEAKREYVDEEIFLTDAEGRRYCRVKECDQVASVDAYCRYHYLLFWKKIQVRKKILTEGKLERYVEELTARYPDKYLEMLRKDLRSEKDFLNAIQELELDDTSGENELEDEAQSYIEEVRGMSSEGGSSRDDDEF